jgi:hypothetical protein
MRPTRQADDSARASSRRGHAWFTLGVVAVAIGVIVFTVRYRSRDTTTASNELTIMPHETALPDATSGQTPPRCDDGSASPEGVAAAKRRSLPLGVTPFEPGVGALPPGTTMLPPGVHPNPPGVSEYPPGT